MLYFGAARKVIFRQFFMLSKPNLTKWRDAGGKEHLIEAMELSHIENCMRKIKANVTWRQEFLPVFEAELKRRSSKLYKVLK